MATDEKRDSIAHNSIKEDVVENTVVGVHNEDMPECLRALSPEEYKRVGRRALLKEDVIMLPCLMITYILNYLDRNNIASAKLAHITDDLHLSGTNYQTCVSILFVGYILMQVPSNMIIGKLPKPAWYICINMCLWGVISSTQSAVKSYGGLVVCRFFIGFIESVFYAGALFYLSLFYNRRQYALRASTFYVGAQMGNAFGGLLAIPILNMDGRYGLEGWRWLFLIEGVVTVGVAAIFAFILPNNINEIRSLTDVEREWVLWNYKMDLGQGDNRNEITPYRGLVLAVSDIKTWLMLGTLYAIYTAAGVTNFFPSVVNSLGFSRTITLVLTAPPFILCCCVMVANGYHSDRTGERYWHIVVPLCITIVANIIAVSTLNTGARYTAMMLMPASFYGASNVLLSWATGTLNQPVAKRAAAIALIIGICNTSNVWTPYTYNGAPRYTLAFAVNLGAGVVAIGFATAARFHLVRQNRKLDRGESLGKSGPTAAQIASGYRYQL